MLINNTFDKANEEFNNKFIMNILWNLFSIADVFLIDKLLQIPYPFTYHPLFCFIPFKHEFLAAVSSPVNGNFLLAD